LANKKKKIRAEFRKNRNERTRTGDWTRHFSATEEETTQDESIRAERISGKGELTRKRTVMVDVVPRDDSPNAADASGVKLGVDATCRRGRVLRVHGLTSTVQSDDGELHRCATRRLLKTLSTDQRHVVAAGDLVYFRSAGGGQGIIERVEPRHGVLARASRGRQHILVTNVDQLVIVASAAEPYLKPNLIDRFLVSAHQSGLRPLVVINKIDLVDPADLQPLVGVYSQMGYVVMLVSVKTGQGIERLRRELAGRSSAVAGQSGVGKSSLLNGIDPAFNLRVGEVSSENQKGKHTTTTAQLWPLSSGGYVVDTPGIRQFQLWDVVAEEVEGGYRDLRPFANGCRFPNCSHVHESQCAVKDAVADGRLDARRYESYCHLVLGDEE
jgi:ribosome biogenesis GTPase / thiamine phosphate phosphatase